MTERLLFELRYDRDGYSVESARAKHRKLPDWYLDEPPAIPYEDYYQKCFWDCATMRNYDHGYIPWNRIREYGFAGGLDDDIIDEFTTIIRRMDEGYLGWCIDNAEKRRQQQNATDQPVTHTEKRRARR